MSPCFVKRVLHLAFGWLLLLFLAPAAWSQTTPGTLDVADCSVIAGWAWVSTQPNVPVDVEILDGSTVVLVVPANLYRADLVSAGRGNGVHGFSVPTPSYLKDGQSHTLSARVAGTQTALGGSPKTLNCASAGNSTGTHGWIDTINCNAIAGWAWRSGQSGAPANVDLYDGPFLIATYSADRFRQDLLTAGVGNGYHGLVMPTPLALRDGQPHQVSLKIAGSADVIGGSPQTLTCAPAASPPAYNGWFDTAACDYIGGWAWVPGVAGPVDIDLYDGNTLVQSIPANQYREDLVNAGVGNGLHGFSLPTPLYLKDGQPHTLTARYGGSAVTVGGSPKTLQCAPPTPVYAGWLDADNCTWIAGWVWDSARPWTAVAIDLYANNQLIATTAAGVYRQDLANAGVGDGRHAFIVSTPVSLKTGQSYSIALKYAGTQTAVPGTPQALNCAPGTAATKLYFIENDHLSTPRRITDMAQQVVWRWDLEEPFGLTPAVENPSSLGAFEFNLRFPGQYRDPESNLHYNHHRDYDPQIGRYVQSDPIGLRGGLNIYVYAFNQPTKFTDPYGLDPFGDRRPSTSPALPGPSDVFFPGTRANNTFVSDIYRLLKKVKDFCTGDDKEDECFKKYERDLTYCDLFYNANGERWWIQCKKEAFGEYQRCRGYSSPD